MDELYDYQSILSSPLDEINDLCHNQAMKTPEATKKAGGVRKLAALLNISTAAVYAWKGTVPELRVFQLEKLLPKNKAAK